MPHLHTPAVPSADRVGTTQGRIVRGAAYYDLFVSVFMLGRRAQLRQETIELAAIKPGATVLEVGCGTGDVALAAKKRVGTDGAVYGIDPSAEMIAIARGKAARTAQSVDFQIGVIEALAFEDASFDVVLSSMMMHHLPSDLKRRGLAEIARVLKPDGCVLIVDFKPATTLMTRMLNTMLFHGSLREGNHTLVPLLREAGFTHVQLGDVSFKMFDFVRGQRAPQPAARTPGT